MNDIKCYIYHHLGLGDHLVCNGLVRELQKRLKTDVHVVVKRQNQNNVGRMYEDSNRIKLFPVDGDRQFLDFINSQPSCRLIKIGFEKCIANKFDQSFYESANIPFEKRWTSWYLQRDPEQEQKILNELNIDGEFVFVHDESSTGKYPLRISSDLRQIRPIKMDCEESMFDWIGVIERAVDIHTISSSFVHLINSLELNNKLYFHNIKPEFGQFSLNQSWQVINY